MDEVIDDAISGHPVSDLAGMGIREGDHGEAPGIHAFKNPKKIQNRNLESFALLSHLCVEIGVRVV